MFDELRIPPEGEEQTRTVGAFLATKLDQSRKSLTFHNRDIQSLEGVFISGLSTVQKFAKIPYHVLVRGSLQVVHKHFRKQLILNFFGRTSLRNNASLAEQRIHRVHDETACCFLSTVSSCLLRTPIVGRLCYIPGQTRKGSKLFLVSAICRPYAGFGRIVEIAFQKLRTIGRPRDPHG